MIKEPIVVVKTIFEANSTLQLYCEASNAVDVAAGIPVKMLHTPTMVESIPKIEVISNMSIGIKISLIKV